MSQLSSATGKRSGGAARAWVGMLMIVVTVSAVTSCATKPGAKVPKAAMDVALDSAGQRMFYKGTAFIPRGFNSATSFELEVDLSLWGAAPEFEPSSLVQSTLGARYRASGLYQPLAHGEGVVSLEAGRVLLRGEVGKKGQELDGDWFVDGKRGGGFRIARKGRLFP